MHLFHCKISTQSKFITIINNFVGHENWVDTCDVSCTESVHFYVAIYCTWQSIWVSLHIMCFMLFNIFCGLGLRSLMAESRLSPTTQIILEDLLLMSSMKVSLSIPNPHIMLLPTMLLPLHTLPDQFIMRPIMLAQLTSDNIWHNVKMADIYTCVYSFLIWRPTWCSVLPRAIIWFN